MNKKKIVLIVAIVLAAAVIAAAMYRPQKAESSTENARETTAVGSEESTEQVGFANEAIAGEPAPFDDKTAVTIPGESNFNKKHQDGTNKLPIDIDASLEIEQDDSFDADLDDMVLPDEMVEEAMPEIEIPDVDDMPGLPEDFDLTTLTYEAYIAMNGKQQDQVIAMFSTPEEFVLWYRAAEAQYKAENPDA